jgi:hypothetical protein
MPLYTIRPTNSTTSASGGNEFRKSLLLTGSGRSSSERHSDDVNLVGDGIVHALEHLLSDKA